MICFISDTYVCTCSTYSWKLIRSKWFETFSFLLVYRPIFDKFPAILMRGKSKSLKRKLPSDSSTNLIVSSIMILYLLFLIVKQAANRISKVSWIVYLGQVLERIFGPSMSKIWSSCRTAVSYNIYLTILYLPALICKSTMFLIRNIFWLHEGNFVRFWKIGSVLKLYFKWVSDIYSDYKIF